MTQYDDRNVTPIYLVSGRDIGKTSVLGISKCNRFKCEAFGNWHTSDMEARPNHRSFEDGGDGWEAYLEALGDEPWSLQIMAEVSLDVEKATEFLESLLMLAAQAKALNALAQKHGQI